MTEAILLFQIFTDKSLAFNDNEALEVIKAFIERLWKGKRSPAEIYTQKSGLPIILSFASNGTYKEAMGSIEAMNELIDHLHRMFDDAANMGW